MHWRIHHIYGKGVQWHKVSVEFALGTYLKNLFKLIFSSFNRMTRIFS